VGLLAKDESSGSDTGAGVDFNPDSQEDLDGNPDPESNAGSTFDYGIEEEE
jgi:hypothetical protein